MNGLCGPCLSVFLYPSITLLSGTVCLGFQLIVRWKTSQTQTKQVCSWRTSSSGPTTRLRWQRTMEQAGAPTATKSLSGLCKEVRVANRQYYSKSRAQVNHCLQASRCGFQSFPFYLKLSLKRETWHIYLSLMSN